MRDQRGYDRCEILGSPHSGGCHFVFCDGSIQSISYDIDAMVFQRLGDRGDGETIDKSDL